MHLKKLCSAIQISTVVTKVYLIGHKSVTVEYFVIKNSSDTKKTWICFEPDLDWIVLAGKAFYKR